MRPRLLDLFCGAGGAAMGYHRAGFDVVGIDLHPQPRFPFRFVQGDALRPPVDLAAFDAIHASPPCQAYSSIRALAERSSKTPRAYVDLIAQTRRLLVESGLPYVIENVVGAPLRPAVRLCGSSFSLPLRRHRLFECSVALLVPPCAHGLLPVRILRGVGSPSVHRKDRERAAIYPSERMLSRFYGVYGGTHFAGEGEGRKRAMGIDWMTQRELT